MDAPVDVSKYDNNIPPSIKGFIGSLAALLLLPPIALSIAMKFGGFESIIQDWVKAQLKVSEPIVESSNNLAIQMLELNRTLLQFKQQMDQQSTIIDQRLSIMDETMTIHSEQLNNGLKQLQKLQDWAYNHSKDSSYDYR